MVTRGNVMHFRKAAASGILLLIHGCSSSPVDPTYVTQQLINLSATVFDSPSGPMISVFGTLADGVRLEDGEALQVLISTSSSEGALVGLVPSICGSPGKLFLCRGLIASLKLGADFEGVRSLLASLDAAFTHISTGPDRRLWGSIYVFSGSPERVLVEMSRHPDVDDVDWAGTGEPGAGSSGQVAAIIVHTLGVTPAPRSARFTLLSGDTVTVTYTQPDGTSLTASAVVR